VLKNARKKKNQKVKNEKVKICDFFKITGKFVKIACDFFIFIIIFSKRIDYF